MATTRHIFVCEGSSERTYLLRLQSFLEKLPATNDDACPRLMFLSAERHIAGSGYFGNLKAKYALAHRENRNSSIQIWTDFDLYHRNDGKSSELYANKQGLPDFLFSFHNFEDFIALHTSGDELREWLSLGNEGYFENPAPSTEHSELIKKMVKGYKKGSLPADFVTKERLMNLKANLSFQPKSNPHRLQNIGKFADFLIGQLERHHPEVLR